MKKTYPEIGSVTFRSSRRNKRINISIRPFQGISVSYPPFFGINKAELVLMQNMDWIKQKLEVIKKRENNLSIQLDTQWKSLHHTFLLKAHSEEKFSICILDQRVIMFFPEDLGLENENVRRFITESLESILRKEAKAFLPGRIMNLSLSTGIPFNELRINKAKTRWGSCSSKNNINLSLYLMLLPVELIDYVILHELAHVKVKNHSKAYWDQLESICRDSKKLDRQLKEKSRQLII